MVSEADFIAAQDIHAACGPAPRDDVSMPERRRYLLSGLLVCGTWALPATAHAGCRVTLNRSQDPGVFQGGVLAADLGIG